MLTGTAEWLRFSDDVNGGLLLRMDSVKIPEFWLELRLTKADIATLCADGCIQPREHLEGGRLSQAGRRRLWSAGPSESGEGISVRVWDNSKDSLAPSIEAVGLVIPETHLSMLHWGW